MSLREYKRKRDFSRTKEPEGTPSAGRKDEELRFVIQKHAARRLHYDFRLEMGGVLKSWAVPRGIPAVQGEKRLAVQVEDHPLAYGTFEGTIAEGNYGAGTVMVWDRGVYRVLGGDPETQLKKGKLHLELEGEKLKGEWTLVRMRSKESEKEQWLLLKTGAGMRPISARRDDQSVLSQRTMEEIGRAPGKSWRSNRLAGEPKRSVRKRRDPKAVEWLVLDRLKPGTADFIEPMKCLLVDKLPRGVEWIYEIKFDGYRALAVKAGNRTELISRNRNKLTGKFLQVADWVQELPATDVVIDGEIVALDNEGRSTFQLLQSYELDPKNPPPLAYYAFDLLILNGKDVRPLPLVERKKLLRQLAKNFTQGLLYSGEIQAESEAVLNEMKRRGLEGVIAKKKQAPYEAGRRSGAWVKFKWTHEQEMVIGGYTRPEGTRSHFGALLVGYYEGGKLVFVSKVGTGFDQRMLRFLHGKFQPLIRDDCPFVNLPEKRGARGQGITASAMKRCTWVEPELVAQIRFSEWTRDNHLRHPVFLGLREDKAPREVVKEQAR